MPLQRNQLYDRIFIRDAHKCICSLVFLQAKEEAARALAMSTPVDLDVTHRDRFVCEGLPAVVYSDSLPFEVQTLEAL